MVGPLGDLQPPTLSTNNRSPRTYSKTASTPNRPYESARLDAELKLDGEFGLKNKREIYRIGLQLSKIRRAARELLTRDEKDPKRLFEGNALIRRLVRLGVLPEDRMKLDYVLALSPRISSSDDCRPRSSSSVWPSPSTTPECSSLSDTSESASRLSTFLLSWFDSSPRSTLTLPSTLPTEEDDPAELSERTPRRVPPRTPRRRRTRSNRLLLF